MPMAPKIGEALGRSAGIFIGTAEDGAPNCATGYAGGGRLKKPFWGESKSA